jgi:CheY-like chemotaxis protein
MEAIGRLAGGVAHDFNNLLTVILGTADMLVEARREDTEVVEDLNEIRKAADAAATLTRQLLAFSRQHVVEPRRIVVEDVLANTGKMVKRLIGEDVELVMQTSHMPSAVWMDPGQLEQIVMNLAINARDAMPGGGTLTIETQPIELDDSYARSHWEVTPGRYVLVGVSDTGMGMDEFVREHIFEPFFTTKEAGKGTGLGLSTVYGIVKQASGLINVYSEPGRGASFKIYLPISDATEMERANISSAGALSGTESVLVVEDAAAVRSVVLQALRRRGYRTLEAPNATVALSMLANPSEEIDLMLTDVVMPDMGGRELAQNAELLRPGLRIVYMSGYTDEAVVRQGVLERGVHYIQKPFSPDALARLVRRVLDWS